MGFSDRLRLIGPLLVWLEFEIGIGALGGLSARRSGAPSALAKKLARPKINPPFAGAALSQVASDVSEALVRLICRL